MSNKDIQGVIDAADQALARTQAATARRDFDRHVRRMVRERRIDGRWTSVSGTLSDGDIRSLLLGEESDRGLARAAHLFAEATGTPLRLATVQAARLVAQATPVVRERVDLSERAQRLAAERGISFRDALVRIGREDA